MLVDTWLESRSYYYVSVPCVFDIAPIAPIAHSPVPVSVNVPTRQGRPRGQTRADGKIALHLEARYDSVDERPVGS
jgi:hypothetical protein